MATVRLILAAGLLGLLLFAAGRPVGPLPPVAPLLDPMRGVWRLAARAEAPARAAGTIPTLDGPVEVRVDDRGVPHVFATSEQDAWRVQGWLVARDRLFQMSLQTRATAGRLSEWAGAAALPADRRSREMALARTAERQWTALAPNDPSRLAMEAYAEGVNAWIDQLGAADLPLEFRLLGARPDRWQPQHALYLFQQMGSILARDDAAAYRARFAALVGWEAAEALVPVHSPVQEPIQPSGQFAARVDPLRLPPPGPPESAPQVLAKGRGDELARAAGDAVGSNNWAVAPGRTAAGHALLAGDPHLNLSLPSIWYEVHLVVPGVLDVAGATIPGAPGVIIGFNRSVAWSVTNTGSDVLDSYRETVDDEVSPRQYRLDGAWRDLILEEETYRDARGRVLATDTLRFTHRGPMVQGSNGWHSTRWTMQEAALPDPNVWLRLNRAANTDAALRAVAEYVGPTQNFLFADQAGTIAVRSTGYYPIRPGDGRGDVIRDGSTGASDWQGWLPLESYPFSRNPAQRFLASANQEPVDPRERRGYLGADWPVPWRAMRINSLLRADSAVTPEAMRRFQTDPGSAAADLFVPHFLRAAALALTRDSSRTALARAAAVLAEWDRRYTPENRRAVLFDLSMMALGRATWDELIPAGDSVPTVQPSQAILAALLDQPDSPWWDDRRTEGVERRDDVLARALEEGWRVARERHGEPDGPGWLWSGIRHANIYHLLRLGPLSRLKIPVPGGIGTLSPAFGGGTHGASWRMVVELGPEVRARTTYPGGQSGHPLNRRYADRLAQWAAGDLGDARFPRTAAELDEGAVSAVVSFVAGGGR